jgi:hypothetical protein
LIKFALADESLQHLRQDKIPGNDLLYIEKGVELVSLCGVYAGSAASAYNPPSPQKN